MGRRQQSDGTSRNRAALERRSGSGSVRRHSIHLAGKRLGCRQDRFTVVHGRGTIAVLAGPHAHPPGGRGPEMAHPQSVALPLLDVSHNATTGQQAGRKHHDRHGKVSHGAPKQTDRKEIHCRNMRPMRKNAKKFPVSRFDWANLEWSSPDDHRRGRGGIEPSVTAPGDVERPTRGPKPRLNTERIDRSPARFRLPPWLRSRSTIDGSVDKIWPTRGFCLKRRQHKKTPENTWFSGVF